ncbi:PREDICTED: mucin-5AC-like [Dufourea novaeangliae]|uniref:mucin-5AC-like n=1 Tax=Dufourea novaeangliae TaxID=178035 RepID=UPI000767B20C|nr:PREDICTED: mucin-5AC-like [Dufourea novaeangliae]
MRSNLVKIVVVLLLCRSGDARPQRTGESTQLEAAKSIVEERSPVQTASVPSNVQDSRYTWNSGSSRIPYVNYYRDNVNSLFGAEILHWKNWPNGAIQTANDYQNYEKYTSFAEDLKPEETVKRPVTSTNNSTDHLASVSSPDVQEIVHWWKIPAFMTNGSHIIESDEANDPVSVVFDPIYQNLEPNKPLKKPSNIPSFRPGSFVPIDPPPIYTTEKIPGWSAIVSLKNKTNISPQTQISQNTVVHLINTDPRKPNKTTIVGTKGPGNTDKPIVLSAPDSHPSVLSSKLTSSTTVKPGPNVHIGFIPSENIKVPVQQDPQPPMVTYDQRCPTILINSYTRINNTIQSKEGCTDLNIIINSHVFNTNTFKSTPSPLDQAEVHQAYEEADKYIPVETVPGYQSNSQENYYSPQKDPQTIGSQENDPSNVEVFQGTEINISGNEAFPPSSSEEIDQFSDDPTPVEDSPIADEANQASNDPNYNSVVRPVADAADPSAAGQDSSSSSPSSGLVTTSSPASASSYNDDDDDDDFDLSPIGIMESIASVFAYFTFVNPLHYGFFSVAAAPFTALAAGVLGMATVAFPWLFPSTFGYSRANDEAVSFWPSVEDVIRQSMEKYGSNQQNDSQRHIKDLQYMDQSLRTVATQLLNVTSPEDGKIADSIVKKTNNNKKSPERDDVPMKEMTVTNGHLVNVGFGRPINSKFSFFETSHPGQAMAITEEELEKEISSTRLMTAHKNHPTTTGGISTWILLNPPSTTIKTIEVDKRTKQPSENEVMVTVKPTTLMERIDTTERMMEKVTLPVSTTVIVEEPSTTRKIVLLTTKRTDFKTSTPETVQTTLKPVQTTSKLESKDAPVSTTKKVLAIRTTPKPKTATSKTTILSKPLVSKTSRPNQQARPKPLVRRTTVKPDLVKNETASTAKIEKVTFRPVQMITVSKSKPENIEKPMFVTKIKASVLMDTQKTTTALSVPSTTNQEPTTTLKTVSSTSEPVEATTKLKPVTTKNNVLKAQLKRPLDEPKIEIQPIKVNAPVLKIEKIEKDESKEDQEKDILNDSRIDLKFDFNPELTKINVDSETSTSTTPSSSTTKRTRQTSKRKKNKGRRRKPSTSTTTTTIAPTKSSSTEMELTMTTEPVLENGIQESKIAPDTKISVNSTKIKKKQPQKPIGTQIYNFLSREVMPSFGVMSLVGLGLGLASYFLYPFGGTIARRNYEIEPKYKYNLDEYGGNYGQSEEEVLSKVLQGMTTNEENKYPGVKDYGGYYQYQHYDTGYEPQTTKKYPSSPMYRPENTASVLKYRNTDYGYPDTSSTPNYYDRSKHTEYVVGQGSSGSANRQFVVGNIPKEYPPPYEEKNPELSTAGSLPSNYEPTERGQVKFEPDIGQINFPGSVQNYGQVQTARPEEGYEEVEITPSAVAVEHGPRSLKTKRSVDDHSNGPSLIENHRSRRKRDSVIQIIPTKRELEEDEKEENLSNEILNIIDSALPGEKGNELEEDYEVKKRRQKDEDRLKEEDRQKEEEEREKVSTTKGPTIETSTAASVQVYTQESVSSTKEVSTMSSSTHTEDDSDSNVTEDSKTTESNVEWIDLSTQSPTDQDQEGFNLFGFVKKIAEIKLRLGLTLLKHASEGFARYLGHVQKRINGEE